MIPPFHDRLMGAVLVLALLGLVSGLGFWLAREAQSSAVALSAGVVPVLATLLVEIVEVC